MEKVLLQSDFPLFLSAVHSDIQIFSIPILSYCYSEYVSAQIQTTWTSTTWAKTVGKTELPSDVSSVFQKEPNWNT